MFFNSYSSDDESFSPQLLYSLTGEYFVMTEMSHLHKQTELLKKISSQQEKSVTMKIVIEDEKEIDSTAVDENQSLLDISMVEDGHMNGKNTLLSDCRIKRIQEEGQILMEIKKKCTILCYSKVKEVFQSLRNQNKILKQMENELELNYKINSNLLQYKEENDKLKAELQKTVLALSSRQDQEKQKMKMLQERNTTKQALILKNEKNLLLKQKRIVEMKKKVQSIFDHVERQFKDMGNKITVLTACLNQSLIQDGSELNQTIKDSTIEIVKSWQSFGNEFKSKLQ